MHDTTWYIIGVSGGPLWDGDRRLVRGVHHGGDAPAQASLHGLQHGADAEAGGAVHGETVRGGLDLRHQQEGDTIPYHTAKVFDLNALKHYTISQDFMKEGFLFFVFFGICFLHPDRPTGRYVHVAQKYT